MNHQTNSQTSKGTDLTRNNQRTGEKAPAAACTKETHGGPRRHATAGQRDCSHFVEVVVSGPGCALSRKSASPLPLSLLVCFLSF